MNTADTLTHTYTVCMSHQEKSKLCNQIIPLNNQLSKIDVSLILFNFRFFNNCKPTKSCKVLNQSLKNSLFNHVSRMYKKDVVIWLKG